MATKPEAELNKTQKESSSSSLSIELKETSDSDVPGESILVAEDDISINVVSESTSLSLNVSSPADQPSLVDKLEHADQSVRKKDPEKTQHSVPETKSAPGTTCEAKPEAIKHSTQATHPKITSLALLAQISRPEIEIQAETQFIPAKTSTPEESFLSEQQSDPAKYSSQESEPVPATKPLLAERSSLADQSECIEQAPSAEQPPPPPPEIVPAADALEPPSVHGLKKYIYDRIKKRINPIKLPKLMEFTVFDLILDLFSIICYICDIISDVSTAYLHYQENNIWFFKWTIFFIIFPSIVTTLISLRWYLLDHKHNDSPPVTKSRWVIRCIFMTFGMGQIMRYIDAFYYAVLYKMRPNLRNYQYMINEDTDATMLRLFECFLESAPQLLIQLCVIITTNPAAHHPHGSHYFFYVFIPHISCCISLFSIALAAVSYSKSLRMSLPDKENYDLLQMCVQFLWRLMLLASRILVLTVILLQYNIHTCILVFVAHWTLMYLWINSLETNFCETSLEEVLYNYLLAIIFIFCYFNPVESRTRVRVTLYHLLLFLESCLVLGLWYSSESGYIDESKPMLITVHYLLFLGGVSIMALYYCFVHPLNEIIFGRLSLNDLKFLTSKQPPQTQDCVDSISLLDAENAFAHLKRMDLLYKERDSTHMVTRKLQRESFKDTQWITEEEFVVIKEVIEEYFLMHSNRPNISNN